MCALSVVRLSKLLPVFASLLYLPACTSPSAQASASSPSVEEAFLTTGIIELKPYTRSIISSHNF